MNILENIEQNYSSLTRKQRAIADYMRTHTEDMCFMTLKALSAATGVSEMTVLKLCSILGCGSYNALKDAFRALVSGRGGSQNALVREVVNTYSKEELKEDPLGIFGQICREELEGVNDFLSAFSIEEYRKAARMICRARGVILLGSGVSVQMASYLYGRLVECGVACLTVDARREEEVQSALYMLGRDILVMPLFFPEYPVRITRIVSYAREKGADLLGITDNTRSEMAVMCDMCLYCPCHNHFFPDSQTTAVLAANLLAMAVRLEQESMGASTQAAIAIKRVFDSK